MNSNNEVRKPEAKTKKFFRVFLLTTLIFSLILWAIMAFFPAYEEAVAVYVEPSTFEWLVFTIILAIIMGAFLSIFFSVFYMIYWVFFKTWFDER